MDRTRNNFLSLGPLAPWSLPHFKPLGNGRYRLRFAMDDPLEIGILPVNCARMIAISEITDVNRPTDTLTGGVR